MSEYPSRRFALPPSKRTRPKSNPQHHWACRRTFGQSCIDSNVPLDSVSLIMGHGSTKTTESYYCQKREEVALKEKADSWQSEIPRSAETSLTENEKYLSGYA